MNLTPHFTLAEMTRSETASRRGIANVPGPAVIKALELLCVNVLEPVRAHYGLPVIVTSGYRSPKVNAAIGGSSTSQHCFGMAADFTVAGVRNIDVAQWMQRRLKYDQLIYEFGESGWVHCSWNSHRLRNMELTARHGHAGYLPGLVA